MSVFGSCVTRDAFEFGNPDYEVNAFAARATIRSLMSTDAIPMDEAEELLRHDPTIYRQRFVAGDLTKSVIQDLTQTRGDYMIIDLTSEIIPTMRWRGTLVTVSDYFKMLIPPEQWKDIPTELSGSSQVMEETLKLIPAFVRQFTEAYGEDHVLLHEAICAEYFFDQNRMIFPFDEGTLHTVKRLNSVLEAYYHEIKLHFPGIRAIRVSPNNIYGDVTHKWGLSFFHYVPEYYHEFLYKLKRITAPR